jgi:hypothetical protein
MKALAEIEVEEEGSAEDKIDPCPDEEWKIEREEDLKQAHDPRYCGHSFQLCGYHGGGYGCKVLGGKCKRIPCPIVTKWETNEYDGIVNASWFCLTQLVKELKGCPFCGVSLTLGGHRRWCVLGYALSNLPISQGEAEQK